jgi:hypothetical protein
MRAGVFFFCRRLREGTNRPASALPKMPAMRPHEPLIRQEFERKAREKWLPYRKF